MYLTAQISGAVRSHFMSFSTLLDSDAKKAAADCPDTIRSIKMHPPHRHRNGDRDRR
jgi:hypothetical protein